MLIQNLFERPIDRPINGVVKADQLDPATVWQELEEFVVTRELDQHIRRFFSAYLDGIDHRGDPDIAGRIGVWVSGFFGSGKSHFIKILNYILRNVSVASDGQTRRAIDFFETKVADAMVLGDIKRAVATNTDAILFNIDSKASHKAGRDAILQVFLKVLNEMQGYSGDHPHIAHMERYLAGKGKLHQFQAAFKKATGNDWTAERDAYEFNRDEVITAFSEATGQSKESAEKWIDNAPGNFSLTVENFAKWVKEYLDSKSPDHRIVFIVDEVGQFIGGDSHLMLNLQTITEELGVACQGRAWVIVTSQEDIDAVLGEMKQTRANDFSKIQGRFKTRLSLSSANVDEVIQSRLLKKDQAVVPDLQALFGQKGDIIKNQLTFTNVGMTLKPYRDADDFVKNYPFAPYQFLLMQKVFESIRKAGATGLHLSRGERSILDAFQTAAKQVRTEAVGVLVPLYRFYPAIESFLDTAVKRTIDQAKERNLEAFDIDLLKVLFLIRYVEEMKGNVDNLVTLCIDQIDADKLALRRRIEESLARLEKETLVNRSGDIYSFLTNEERDVSREIKNEELTGGEEAKLLGEIIFDDVLKGQRKYRYPPNKMDFSFVRICDQHLVGNRVEGGLTVSVISPLNDDFSLYLDARCLLESSTESGQVLIRLADNEALGRELRTYKKTDKYLANRSDAPSEATRKIHRGFAEENRQRRSRLTTLLTDMLVEAKYFVAGQPFVPKAAAPGAVLEEAQEYLVKNTFTKMGLLKRLHDDPLVEIQAALRCNDIAQLQLGLQAEDSNAQALADVRSYVELCTKTTKQIVLFDMIENRYANRPYGWPQLETALLVSQLLVLGEISLMMDGGTIPLDKTYEPLTTPNKWRKIIIVQRRSADPQTLQAARNLGKQVFSEMGPDGEDALFTFLRGKLAVWQTSLTGYKSLAETGNYPGAQEIGTGLMLIKTLLTNDESFKFIERFNAAKTDLLDLCDSYHDLENFYEHQKPTWEKLRKAFDRLGLNRLDLERDSQAAASLRRMGEILTAPAPYSLINEADALIQAVETVNQALISKRRTDAMANIDKHLTAMKQELETAKADAGLRTACLTPLDALKIQVAQQESLAHITQAEQEAERMFDAGVARITQWLEQQRKQQPKPDEPPKPTPKPIQVIKPAELMPQAYLESDADIDVFLEKLRKSLKAAVSENKRVQIR